MTFDPKAFVRDLVSKWQEHDCADIDGGDFQELLTKHGLVIERPLTKRDMSDKKIADDAAEWDASIGDLWLFPSSEYKAWLND